MNLLQQSIKSAQEELDRELAPYHNHLAVIEIKDFIVKHFTKLAHDLETATMVEEKNYIYTSNSEVQGGVCFDEQYTDGYNQCLQDIKAKWDNICG